MNDDEKPLTQKEIEELECEARDWESIREEEEDLFNAYRKEWYDEYQADLYYRL